jgi:hypothetical protein
LEDNTQRSGAKSGALGERLGSNDPDLNRVINAWPDLSAGARRQVLQTVEEAFPRR